MAAGTLSAPVPTAHLSEVLGDPLRAGEPLPAAPLLSLLDLVCGRCAATFSLGNVVTACFDDVSLLRTPRHGDIAHATARVVSVGRSSMVLQAVVRPDDGGDTLAEALATFVAVRDGEVAGSRRVDHEVPRGVHMERGAAWGWGDAADATVVSELKRARGVMWERDSVALEQAAGKGAGASAVALVREGRRGNAAVVVRKQFLPRHLNRAGVVFGGDILEVLEAVALASVRKKGGGRCVSAAVKALSFVRPVPLDKVLQVEARVVGGGGGMMAVVVRTFIDERHDGKDLKVAHAGVFHVVMVDADGYARGGQAAPEMVGEGEARAEALRALALPVSYGLSRMWGVDAYPARTC